MLEQVADKVRVKGENQGKWCFVTAHGTSLGELLSENGARSLAPVMSRRSTSKVDESPRFDRIDGIFNPPPQN